MPIGGLKLISDTPKMPIRGLKPISDTPKMPIGGLKPISDTLKMPIGGLKPISDTLKNRFRMSMISLCAALHTSAPLDRLGGRVRQ